jgi:hypothetical protein
LPCPASRQLGQFNLLAQVLGSPPPGSLHPLLLGLLRGHSRELRGGVEANGTLLQRVAYAGQGPELSRQRALGPQRRSTHPEPLPRVLVF